MFEAVSSLLQNIVLVSFPQARFPIVRSCHWCKEILRAPWILAVRDKIRQHNICVCRTGKATSSQGQEKKELQCPTPKKPSNGKLVSCNDRSFQGSCKITCDRGYYLHGPSVRYCATSGNSLKWTGNTPTCRVKTCKSLTKPQNGQVMPEICTTAPKHRQKCTFSCNAGYTGSKNTPFSITCDDGHWSSSTVFYCSDLTPPKFDNCPSPLNVSADSGST